MMCCTLLDRLNRKILSSSWVLKAHRGAEKSIIMLENMAKSELSISEKQESKTDLCDALANTRNRGCMLIEKLEQARDDWKNISISLG